MDALRTSFAGVPTSMTLNDLEPQNRGFSKLFAILGCDAHLEWIFTEITGDRPISQPAYEIKLMLSRVSWAEAQISCYCYYYATVTRKARSVRFPHNAISVRVGNERRGRRQASLLNQFEWDSIDNFTLDWRLYIRPPGRALHCITKLIFSSTIK